jgi:UDP-N-acetylmuramyl pentapeptide phosphotransferase/UDP-N-acetylglucosamine-1-phosphate transferase
MGDAGSAFLGAFFGVQSVLAPLTTQIPFPVLVLPFANFVLDTTFTLLRRMWRGEKWYQAHRSHFYQRMTSLGMSHGKVTGCELMSVALSCVAAVWYLRSGFPGRVAVVAAVAAGFIAGGTWIFKRERASEP